MAEWPLGVIIGLCGCVAGSIGTILVRLSHVLTGHHRCHARNLRDIEEEYKREAPPQLYPLFDAEKSRKCEADGKCRQSSNNSNLRRLGEHNLDNSDAECPDERANILTQCEPTSDNCECLAQRSDCSSSAETSMGETKVSSNFLHYVPGANDLDDLNRLPYTVRRLLSCSTPTKLWWTGMMGTSALSPVCSGLAVAYAPACIAVSLSAINIVLNQILAAIFLGEVLTIMELMGSIQVTFGMILMVSYAGKAELSIDEMEIQLYTFPSLLYIAICGSLIGCLLTTSFIVMRLLDKMSEVKYPDSNLSRNESTQASYKAYPNWTSDIIPISICALETNVQGQTFSDISEASLSSVSDVVDIPISSRIASTTSSSSNSLEHSTKTTQDPITSRSLKSPKADHIHNYSSKALGQYKGCANEYLCDPYPSKGLEAQGQLYSRSTTAPLVLAVVDASTRLMHDVNTHPASFPNLIEGIEGATMNNSVNEESVLHRASDSKAWIRRLRPVLFGVASGLCCGSTTLSGKIAITSGHALLTDCKTFFSTPHGLADDMLPTHDLSFSWSDGGSRSMSGTIRSEVVNLFFASMTALLSMAIADLFFMTKCLEVAPAIFLTNVRCCIAFLVGTMGAIVLFIELPVNAVWFSIGSLFCIAGIVQVSLSRLGCLKIS